MNDFSMSDDDMRQLIDGLDLGNVRVSCPVCGGEKWYFTTASIERCPLCWTFDGAGNMTSDGKVSTGVAEAYKALETEYSAWEKAQ